MFKTQLKFLLLSYPTITFLKNQNRSETVEVIDKILKYYEFMNFIHISKCHIFGTSRDKRAQLLGEWRKFSKYTILKPQLIGLTHDYAKCATRYNNGVYSIKCNPFENMNIHTFNNEA